MPYIPVEQREACDGLIEALAGEIVRLAEAAGDSGAFAGLLNYACTRLALQIVHRRFGRLRYWLIALLTGIFKNIADEFYRRLAGPYEDRQMLKSGDVDLYEQYLAEIEKIG